MSALRRQVISVTAISLVLYSAAGMHAQGTPPPAATKPAPTAPASPPNTVAVKLKALSYPGSTPESNVIEPWVGQTVTFTTDDLQTVETWYRTKLGIDKAFVGGVAHLPWPPGATVLVKERRQWSLAQDDVRPKRDGSGHKTVRAGTVRNLVLRTPEGTLIVLLNRTPADTETMIALTYLPPEVPK